eukprot:jgi/Hompol1/5043/HPOL_000734-RA
MGMVAFVLPSFLFGLWAILKTPSRVFKRSLDTPATSSGSDVTGQSSIPGSASTGFGAAGLTFWTKLLRAQANFVLGFLNAAFVLAVGLELLWAVTMWIESFLHAFNYHTVVNIVESDQVMKVCYQILVTAQTIYFLTSIWMKHRLIRSLPGSSTASVSKPKLWISLSSTMVCLFMNIVAWFYVLLAIDTVRHDNTNIADAMRIVYKSRVLRVWLLLRPILPSLFSIAYFIAIIARQSWLDVNALVSLTIVVDFFFEYSQIHYGLFAKLVSEISLPPDVRDKMKRIQASQAFADEDDWANDIPDGPEAFEMPAQAASRETV